MKKSRIIMVLAMAIFGTLGLFVRNIPLSSGELALYRAVLGAGLIGIYLLFNRGKISFGNIRRDIPILVLSGIAMGVNWIFLFEAYNYTSVSVATLSYYFAPVIVTAVCPFLFHERMTRRQLVCFLMSTLGIILIIDVSGFGSGSADWIGVLYGLGAAVFYATVVLLNKFIRHVDGIPRTFLQLVSSLVILIPHVLFNGGFHLAELETVGLINLLIVGIFHTGITYCMYFSSIKELPGQEASILSYVDPLVAVLVSFAFLGESMSWLQVLGGALILGFALLNELGGQTSPNEEKAAEENLSEGESVDAL